MAEHATDEDQAEGLVARWQQTEPLRLWLYGIAVPLVALLVGYGLLSGHLAGLWLAVAAAALLGGGVEGARQFAVSPATARAAITEAASTAPFSNAEDRAAAREVLVRYRIP